MCALISAAFHIYTWIAFFPFSLFHSSRVWECVCACVRCACIEQRIRAWAMSIQRIPAHAWRFTCVYVHLCHFNLIIAHLFSQPLRNIRWPQNWVDTTVCVRLQAMIGASYQYLEIGFTYSLSCHTHTHTHSRVNGHSCGNTWIVGILCFKLLYLYGDDLPK